MKLVGNKKMSLNVELIHNSKNQYIEFKTSFQNGSGIARIQNECKKHGKVKVRFEEFKYGFKIIFLKLVKNNNVGVNENKIEFKGVPKTGGYVLKGSNV